jgi:SEC-C motif-containing protein
LNNSTLCLCGSGIAYQQCCEPYHFGEKIPATAEALMRSRYTAYVLRNAVYLQETWDATRRPEKIDFSRENIDWLRLEITEIKKGEIKDSKGVVAFKAFYSQDDEEHVMNEISRFTKINGRWFYLDGVIKSMGKVNQQTNHGKNALCSCGSGKKFKRCCGTE